MSKMSTVSKKKIKKEKSSSREVSKEKSQEVLFLSLKKILCFGQHDPTYRNRPTLDFFYENTVVFFVGVFIIEVSILKKTKKNPEPTLPKVFKTVALNTRFFFGLIVDSKDSMLLSNT